MSDLIDTARADASECCDGYEGQIQMLQTINRDLNRQLMAMERQLESARDALRALLSYDFAVNIFPALKDEDFRRDASPR